MPEEIIKIAQEKEEELIGDLYEVAQLNLRQLIIDSKPVKFAGVAEWQGRFETISHCITGLKERACININAAHHSIKTDN